MTVSTVHSRASFALRNEFNRVWVPAKYKRGSILIRFEFMEDVKCRCRRETNVLMYKCCTNAERCLSSTRKPRRGLTKACLPFTLTEPLRRNYP